MATIWSAIGAATARFVAAQAVSWTFADGRRIHVDALNATTQIFASRPAVCEYVPDGPPKHASGDVALLMVVNSPHYLFRLWLLFLNKLLFATDAGLRPFLWARNGAATRISTPPDGLLTAMNGVASTPRLRRGWFVGRPQKLRRG